MGVDLTQLAYAQNSYRAFLLLPPPGVGNLWLCSSLQHYMMVRCCAVLLWQLWLTEITAARGGGLDRLQQLIAMR